MDLHEALYTTRAMRRVRPDPIPLDVQARILDAASHAPSGGNQQNWRFLLLDDPAKKAALAPMYQHAMGELWKSVYKDQLDAARADPDAPESVQMFKVQRSAQWLADHFEDIPLYLFPFSQHDPTGSSIYPAVWSAMLAARAEGVGSCLTALLQFFNPAETLEILEVPTDEGWILSGTVSFGYPTGTWGIGTAAPGAPCVVPQRMGRRRRLRGARTPVAGLTDLTVPFAGTVLRVAVSPGDHVAPGDVLVVLESMKMEHVVEAATPGRIDSVKVGVGDAVRSGDVVVTMTESDELVDRRGDAASSAPRPRYGPSSRSCAPASKPPGTPGARRPPSAGTRSVGGRPGRTSRTSATPAASTSTARSSSRHSGHGAASTTSSPTRPPTA